MSSFIAIGLEVPEKKIFEGYGHVGRLGHDAVWPWL